MGQVQCSCDGSEVNIAAGPAYSQLKPMIHNQKGMIPANGKKLVIVEVDSIQIKNNDSDNDIKFSKVIDIKDLNTNHGIWENIDNLQDKNLDNLNSNTDIVVNNQVIPEDINEFKETVQQTISTSDELTNQDQPSPRITQKVLHSENSSEVTPAATAYQAIKLSKKMQNKPIGRSKRMLVNKLVSMGVVTVPSRSKSFFFF